MGLLLSPTQLAFNARGDGFFNKPFPEQVDFFRGKLNLPTEFYDDILRSAHDRAFVVAGAMKADLLNDLRLAVDRSIAEGKSIGWFRKEFEAIVAKHGWTGWTGSDTAKGRAWRTRVIYQTNMAASYAAGRRQQMLDPDLLKSRPYWKYHHSDLGQKPRPLHVAWSGLVLHHTDPWWATHYPPQGIGCRCRVIPVRASEYEGATAPDEGVYVKEDRFGVRHVIPKGIDYGWDYAPGANAATPMKDMVEAKLIRFPASIGADMLRALQPVLAREAAKANPVSKALVLPTDSTALAATQLVLNAIDSVHGDGELPKIPVEVAHTQDYDGKYVFHSDGSAKGIHLSSYAAQPELTMTHEIGHFIDHQAIGVKGVNSSESDALFDEWRQAVDASLSTKLLNKLYGKIDAEHLDYLLLRQEQWARSYAQYIAVKSNDAVLRRQLADRLSHIQAEDRYRQWRDEDFAPIMAAIDNLFRGLGWI